MKTLKEYKGVLHSDKYGVYEKLAKTEKREFAKASLYDSYSTVDF
jgi:hypothetical protein